MKKKHMSFFHIIVIFLLTVSNAFSFPLWLSLGIDALLALFLAGKGYRKVSKSERGLISLLMVLCIYTILVCVANVEFNSYTLGKPLRLIVFYALFIYLSGRLSTYKIEEIAGGVLLALLMHLACVYGQFFFPSIKNIFTSFLRFDDKLEILEDPLRAFGLDASFDGAGLDICVLLLLLWLIFKRTKDLKYFLLGGMALLGCFMVGRTAMLVGSAVFAMMLLSLLRKNKIYFVFVAMIFGVAVFYLWDVFQFYMDNNDVMQSYRPETVNWLTSDRMLFLPDSILGSIFGTGLSPSNSDIGYIKIIHMIGFVGLLLVLYLYISTIKAIKPFKRIDKDVNTFMLIFLLLLLAYNYKLLLLYSRGINDVYFLLIFIILRKQSTINANNQVSRL